MSIAEGLGGGVADGVGGVEIGFSDAEGDDIFSGGFKGFGFGTDGKGR